MEHRRRVERKREEKELTAKQERMRKAREAAQKARKVINCHSLRIIMLSCTQSRLIYVQWNRSILSTLVNGDFCVKPYEICEQLRNVLDLKHSALKLYHQVSASHQDSVRTSFL